MRIALIFLVLLVSFASSCKNFDKYMNMFCRYGLEQSPCTVEDYSTYKSACCAMKNNCSYKEFPKDDVCCFTVECLKRCFPEKLLKNDKVY
ncbi:Lipoprotein [Caenorhabditis elegans]|uniref:Lipoprotein n=1 Tax=Caenorhabditis elegans TaxID=6239 RepID=Q9N4F0_CAEEL|nr:Lipoprotein [Caenorhabditis elegans]CCD72403.1 Lipoprotein [Caenorhabditis elegans]|eukprot:NP_497590.1 Uncharacterized protein CELE_Y71H2B.4 [Caenorhabditis elegans]